MPIMTRYDPGTFCWCELGTTDPAAAKRFYTGLMGWQVVDHDMGPSGIYTIFRLDSRDVMTTLTTEAATARQAATAATYAGRAEGTAPFIRHCPQGGGRRPWVSWVWGGGRVAGPYARRRSPSETWPIRASSARRQEPPPGACGPTGRSRGRAVRI